MKQEPKAQTSPDAEYAAAWGDDAVVAKKPSKLAQEAADAVAREQAEFSAEFAREDEGAPK